MHAHGRFFSSECNSVFILFRYHILVVKSIEMPSNLINLHIHIHMCSHMVHGIHTFSRPSRRAAPLELIFDTNTPSSAGSSGLPR